METSIGDPTPSNPAKGYGVFVVYDTPRNPAKGYGLFVEYEPSLSVFTTCLFVASQTKG